MHISFSPISLWARLLFCIIQFVYTEYNCVVDRIFGFVARKPGSATDNACHLFSELDQSQPAAAVVAFVEKLMKESR